MAAKRTPSKRDRFGQGFGGRDHIVGGHCESGMRQADGHQTGALAHEFGERLAYRALGAGVEAGAEI